MMSKQWLKLALFCACVATFSFTTVSISFADSPSPESPDPLTSALSSTKIDDLPNIDGAVSAAGVGCGGEQYEAYDLAFEQEVIVLVNQVRAEAGRPPLKLSEEFTYAARYHARDMSEDHYFSHDSQDWVNGELAVSCIWHERIRQYVTGPSRLGENIARGYATPEMVMDGWMNSDGHRENLLGDYREFGVGYYNLYWVQNFGERQDVYPIILNDEAAATDSNEVNIYAYGEWSQVRYRMDNGSWSEWMAFDNEMNWTIPQRKGLHAVDVEMKSGDQVVTSSDTIEYIGPEAEETEPVSTSVQPAIFLPLVKR